MTEAGTSPARPIISPLAPYELAKDGAASMPWGHEWLLADLGFATLKRLDMRAGHGGAFQYHERKHEAFVVHSGTVRVTFRGDDGLITWIQIGPGQGFVIPPGAPHKVDAVTDTVMYEVSNAIYDDRVAFAP